MSGLCIQSRKFFFYITNYKCDFRDPFKLQSFSNYGPSIKSLPIEPVKLNLQNQMINWTT